MALSRAQVVATIGPASKDEAIIARMIEQGMDVVRLNFSHGTHEDHRAFIESVRLAAERAGKRVPIIQDLSGPRGTTDDGHAYDAGKSIITEKDLSDLEFGIAQKVDYVAQSYVGTAADVAALRAEMDKRGARIPIIAKIERKQAVDDIDAILKEADAIMVARGDLGLAVPIEDIPFIQRDIIAKGTASGKSVIVATQMLYSMVANPEPTRAEVTDVAFAILSGADAVMLSDETARGKYPVEAVAAMEKVARRAEQAMEPVAIHPL